MVLTHAKRSSIVASFKGTQGCLTALFVVEPACCDSMLTVNPGVETMGASLRLFLFLPEIEVVADPHPSVRKH